MNNYLKKSGTARWWRMYFLMMAAVLLPFSCAQIPSEEDASVMTTEEFDAQARRMNPPAMPEELKVPRNNELFLQLAAEGVQIYQWLTVAGEGKWQLKAPAATLYQQNGNSSRFRQVGTHYDGPTWEYRDGSKIRGSVLARQTVVNSIPWLLLRGVEDLSGRRGEFSGVSYIQRIHTSGGVAPSYAGTREGQEISIAYTAEYLFYRQSGDVVYPYAPAVLRPLNADLRFSTRAEGFQIYTCRAQADGSYAFALKAPDARLFSKAGEEIGTHFAGPTWMANDGSSVIGAVSARSDSPDGSIPWLLLNVTTQNGRGVFTGITQIQRLVTEGGLAPASGCDATTPADREFPVAYKAVYYFYSAPTRTSCR